MLLAELNQQIADFVLPATAEQTIKLSDYRGKNLVLYFYPKDSTPGCTIESKAFRDHHHEFNKANAVILGISRDSLSSHEKFKCKHQFPFELISDTDEKLCDYFNVVSMKSLFGKKFRGIVRSTFLIDKNGVLRQEWRKVKIHGHVKDVLKSVIALNQS